MARVIGIHHLALVTGSLERTIRFWRDLVGLEMRARLGAPGYRQYFFSAGERTLLAFFEWSGAEPVPEKDHGAPLAGRMVFDHVAFELPGLEDLFDLRDRIAAAGFWVSDAMDQGFVRSIYAFDPNGVPVEFAVSVPGGDFREVTLVADRDPGAAALEGPRPRPGTWPAPTSAGDRHLYPGAGSEYFQGKKRE
ncbi:MAG TPA: VOC family protein [Candidatus Methanoperedens sp.]|nr:VOC family protein [Candidatus Methanoperedens sp.]